MSGIDLLVVGHFGEVNKGFKQCICSLAKVAAYSQEAGLQALQITKGKVFTLYSRKGSKLR